MIYSDYPTFVTVDGVKYLVNTDFRLMMELELAVQKNDRHKTADILSAFYFGNLPLQINDAVDEMMRFYLCGGKIPKRKEDHGNPDLISRRCYAFDEDQKYICAAFRQQYGIDLVHSKLHWYEFSSLFSGLTDQTEFVKIMQYRCTNTANIKNSAEKHRILKLKKHYALSENKEHKYSSLEERNKAFAEQTKRRFEQIKREKAEREAVRNAKHIRG